MLIESPKIFPLSGVLSKVGNTKIYENNGVFFATSTDRKLHIYTNSLGPDNVSRYISGNNEGEIGFSAEDLRTGQIGISFEKLGNNSWMRASKAIHNPVEFFLRNHIAKQLKDHNFEYDKNLSAYKSQNRKSDKVIVITSDQNYFPNLFPLKDFIRQRSKEGLASQGYISHILTPHRIMNAFNNNLEINNIKSISINDNGNTLISSNFDSIEAILEISKSRYTVFIQEDSLLSLSDQAMSSFENYLERLGYDKRQEDTIPIETLLTSKNIDYETLLHGIRNSGWSHSPMLGEETNLRKLIEDYNNEKNKTGLLKRELIEPLVLCQHLSNRFKEVSFKLNGNTYRVSRNQSNANQAEYCPFDKRVKTNTDFTVEKLGTAQELTANIISIFQIYIFGFHQDTTADVFHTSPSKINNFFNLTSKNK